MSTCRNNGDRVVDGLGVGGKMRLCLRLGCYIGVNDDNSSAHNGEE